MLFEAIVFLSSGGLCVDVIVCSYLDWGISSFNHPEPGSESGESDTILGIHATFERNKFHPQQVSFVFARPNR